MVICLSGKIASGKSSLTKALIEETGLKYVSFGDYVRNVAVEKGEDPTSRITLQRIGENLIKNDVEKFCIGVLNQIDWENENSFIVEGVRHVEVLNTLKKTIKKQIVLVYIDTRDDLRKDRLKLTDKELGKFDSHSTEVQLNSILKSKADFVIDGSSELKTIVSNLTNQLQI